MIRSRPQSDDGVTVVQPYRPAIGTRAPLLNSRNGGSHQMTEQVVRTERLPEGQPEGQGARSHRGVLTGISAGLLSCPTDCSGAQLCRREGKDVLNGVVEGADAREPRSEGDIAPGLSPGQGDPLRPQS
jgi:hypothetical protein